MTCRIEAACPVKDICEIVKVVRGNPCNPYILKRDTPADYLPGEEPDLNGLRFLLTLNTPRTLKCAAGQIIIIKDK